MNICSTFITNPEPAELGSPSMGAFNNPTVSAKAVFGFDSLACDPRFDSTLLTGKAAPGIVVTLVGVQFGRTESRTASRARDGRNAVQQIFQNLRVMDVGRCQKQSQRNALSVHEKMVFRAWFASICRVRSCRFAPFFAANEAESTDARLQSISPALPNRFKNRWCKRTQTPQACHSFSRLQQVMPLPQPISLGSISQGMPLRRTNRMPVKAARLDTRGRPPFGFGFSGGNNGSICFHSLSSRSGRILRTSVTRGRFC